MRAAQNNYNQSPKPFARSSGDNYQYEQQHLQYRQVPKIVLNNSNNNNNGSGNNALPTSSGYQRVDVSSQHQYQRQPTTGYPKPTSTVHKSLIGSRVNWVSTSNLNETSQSTHNESFLVNQTPYSRLVTSPPPSQTLNRSSYCPADAPNYGSPVQRPSEAQDHQQQQHQSNRPSSFASPYVGSQLMSQDKRLDASTAAKQQFKSSNVVLPDTKRLEYMRDKNLERVSIAHQTYRTTPIVSPKPKARHDLVTGNYMRLNYDPTWDMAATRSLTSAQAKYVGRRVEQAMQPATAGPVQQPSTSVSFAFAPRDS